MGFLIFSILGFLIFLDFGFFDFLDFWGFGFLLFWERKNPSWSWETKDLVGGNLDSLIPCAFLSQEMLQACLDT